VKSSDKLNEQEMEDFVKEQVAEQKQFVSE